MHLRFEYSSGLDKFGGMSISHRNILTHHIVANSVGFQIGVSYLKQIFKSGTLFYEKIT